MSDEQPNRLSWMELEPPKYLLGACLMIWGVLSGHSVLGVVVALLLEWHRWVKWRWSFSDEDYVRVWNLCVVLFLMIAVFRVVGNDMAGWNFTRVFQLWLPILLFPIILVQLFSDGKGVPLVTFSLVARRKRLRDVRSGREVSPVQRVHLGYLYFAVILLSLGSVGRNFPHYYTLTIILLAWGLLALVPRHRLAWASLLFGMASLLGYGLQGGLKELHDYIERRTMEWLSRKGVSDPSESHTRIGEVGEMKLSPRVHWRMELMDGQLPELIPEATYYAYNGGVWRNFRKVETPIGSDPDRKVWEVYSLPKEQSTTVVKLRGTAAHQEEVIPAPENTALLRNLSAETLVKTSMGAFLARPRYATLEYTAVAGKGPPGRLEPLSEAKLDLGIHSSEKEMIETIICEEYSDRFERGVPIKSITTAQEAIAYVEDFFENRGFSYSKFIRGRRSLADFLENNRSGHCEYYATATVLMLRQLGIPARYTVGYAVQEFDAARNEFLLRGTHRHAWARAWDAESETWVDVDTTPGSWIDVEQTSLSGWQKFQEQWDRVMLSWNLWRRSDDKGLLWIFLPLLLAGVLLIVVVLRLVRGFRSKSPTNGNDSLSGGELRVLGMDSGWYRLEEGLARVTEARLPGQSISTWVQAFSAKWPQYRDDLRAIVSVHYQYRFDPQGLSDGEKTQFAKRVDLMLAKLQEEAEPRNKSGGQPSTS